ncbi:PREDICTED: uncharacterized protein LOC109178768 [Ipomoea nil]|uniref:uncharacterized protein LOC109178768 n=1 Tax=Ipomoea nil TaxID=35883 RepID=UPI00090198EB|nr:PREDICTED: uncharacterized protein LOC109178768 [Ipomoea nil]XP_019183869.1 PREDICTED: uncharacterized protein LOC109178768 [Ipomoea nil]
MSISVADFSGGGLLLITVMDLKPFKLDIDDLISEFAEGGSTTLVEMKRVWLSKKFSFIFEASPSTNQACFMQSLFAYSVGYAASTRSLSHRLGGLYCLYCLFETQPFMPPFKIYLSLGELKRLRNLVADAKANNIKVVCALVKRMLERNMFLYGFVDINEGCATERVNELTEIQNARVQTAYEKLFANTRIEHFTHLDMGVELDADLIKQRSTEYAMAKKQAIEEASKIVDIENIKHIMENKRSIGETIKQKAGYWNAQKDAFYQQTGFGHELAIEQEEAMQVDENLEEAGELQEDDFGKELEDVLLSEQLLLENEEAEDFEQD